MKVKKIITLFFLVFAFGLSGQVKKVDLEVALNTFPDLLTKTGAKIMIYSTNGNIQCVATNTKLEIKETAIYVYEYYDTNKTKLSRLLVLPFNSVKDVYIDPNIFSLTIFN